MSGAFTFTFHSVTNRTHQPHTCCCLTSLTKPMQSNHSTDPILHRPPRPTTGTVLASGGRDTDVILWDLITESGLYRLRGHKASRAGGRAVEIGWTGVVVCVCVCVCLFVCFFTSQEPRERLCRLRSVLLGRGQ